MKPIEGAIYCQACVGKVSRQLRWAPEGFALRYPAAHIGKGTCRRCGKTVWLVWANIIIKEESTSKDWDNVRDAYSGERKDDG